MVSESESESESDDDDGFMQIYGWAKIDGVKHLVTYGGGPEGGYVLMHGT